MACVILLVLYIQHELGYDNFFKKAEDIYVIQTSYQADKETEKFLYTTGALAATLEKDYPEVKNAVRVRQAYGLMTYEEKKLQQDKLIYSEEGFFDIFNYKFLYGTPAGALKNPKSIVLTKSLAEKVFGNASIAVDKTVEFDEKLLKVSAVIEDVPDNTSLPFEGVIPIQVFPIEVRKDIGAEGWVGIGCSTFLRLKPNTDYQQLNKKLPELKKYYQEDAKKMGFEAEMKLVPMINLHLYNYGEGSGNAITYILILSALAVFILLIAASNYMNLATARSISRAKEVGIRKVIGSHRKQLIFQFMTEAFITTFLAMLVGLFLAELGMPFFNQIVDKKLAAMEVFKFQNLVGISLIFIFLSFLSGLYPAFVLSSFKPVQVLKGKFSTSKNGLLLRKSLVVFQFTISIVMISSTWMVFQQLRYIMRKDVGFNREQVVIINLDNPDTRKKANILREELLKNTQIKQASLTTLIPGYNSWANNPYNVIPEDGIQRQLMVNDAPVGYGFLETMEMKLISGRNFSREIVTDSTQAAIVNETFVKEAGLKNPLGKTVQSGLNKNRELKIVGVVRDFNIFSLHNSVKPSIMFIPRTNYNLVVRIKPEEIATTMKFMENTFEKIDKKYPFQADFLDVAFAKQYKADQKRGQIFLTFSILSILIACMGIFGVAAFTIQQKRKEIGIRKVLGATLSHIFHLLSIDFVKLVAIASVIAIPLGYYLTNQWLQNFAYRIEPYQYWFVFVLSGVIALVINLITISFQAIKATKVNPVEVLKDE